VPATCGARPCSLPRPPPPAQDGMRAMRRLGTHLHLPFAREDRPHDVALAGLLTIAARLKTHERQVAAERTRRVGGLMVARNRLVPSAATSSGSPWRPHLYPLPGMVWGMTYLSSEGSDWTLIVSSSPTSPAIHGPPKKPSAPAHPMLHLLIDRAKVWTIIELACSYSASGSSSTQAADGLE